MDKVLESSFPHLANKPKINDYDVYRACIDENIPQLIEYKNAGVDFNRIYSYRGETLLNEAILRGKTKSFDLLIEFGVNIENRSHDGFTALNTAAMVKSTYYAEKLIAHGADINTQDDDGFTPLNNAAYFECYGVAAVLLASPSVDVNIPNESGVPVLYYVYVDGRTDIIKQIIAHPNFDPNFNLILLHEIDFVELTNYVTSQIHQYDQEIVDAYDHAKIFGLKYDLDGCIPFTHVDGHQLECFAFDGYMNRHGAVVAYDSYNLFYTQVVSQSNIPSWAAQAFLSVNEALNFSANIYDPSAYYNKINNGDLVIIPSGWDGHSIVFVVHGNQLYRCNRGDMSDGIHGVEEFIISKPENLTIDLIDYMLAAEGASKYLQFDIIGILGLQKTGEIINPTQITGNCVWTSLETSVEASFVSNFIEQGLSSEVAHRLAKDSFLVWEEYDLTSTLVEVIDNKEIYIQTELYDDLLIGALGTHHDSQNEGDVQRAIMIINELDEPIVFERFNQEIGDIMYKYDPQAYDNISSMKSDSISYFDYFVSWVDVFHLRMTKSEYQTAKEYINFFQACDNYTKASNMTAISIHDVVDATYSHELEQVFRHVEPLPTLMAQPLIIEHLVAAPVELVLV